ncbi:MAG: UDP-2,4-diacetamido-2,4,6-trideoxy-beta-L-altropyranose hydrolase [Sulfuricurvum sp.]|uniref:UDP-2,4-diacetamido-2,4, 6-trideoxy-beta-L-altropyranose hydrolase n=1 Tax=Sulfuricurvum sp. TaxID=2025608 RepID=UPI0026264A96|nr:UDP-2,4-diacetamido-2,4,6-trideoxy-beta-L-altropyranose hydrolase [Sulfuricurvum sp.]MDD2830175.1 UDP-2,4-diacetamido-2,4,6-trideoxy-beta-L-altropyranose hydrolase [Sulfuricurvum sp.]MDD4949239.1 UDP-2,4-diacetamido-2,4,6-trideoxy-beta-L-altropyranose hydrolase [Sulfuricurvum sp.]
MNLLIRADSSSTIGLGHIMRDLVLAQQYPHAHITFACQNLVGNIIDKIPYPVHILRTNEPEELINSITSLKINMVIFDHYDIDYSFEKKIKEATHITIMSLDDTYNSHYCDILLNHNISADENRYKDLLPVHCELHCGKDYTLIRDEFRSEKEISREKIYDIFISMGGTDSSNITLDILKSIPCSKKVCLATTTSNPNLNTLLTYTLKSTQIKIHLNSNEIAKLLHQSHLAIITPSVMVHEVLFMEMPFIAIQTASNQDDIVQYLHKHNFCILNEFEATQFQKQLQRFLP